MAVLGGCRAKFVHTDAERRNGGPRLPYLGLLRTRRTYLTWFGYYGGTATDVYVERTTSVRRFDVTSS